MDIQEKWLDQSANPHPWVNRARLKVGVWQETLASLFPSMNCRPIRAVRAHPFLACAIAASLGTVAAGIALFVVSTKRMRAAELKLEAHFLRLEQESAQLPLREAEIHQAIEKLRNARWDLEAFNDADARIQARIDKLESFLRSNPEHLHLVIQSEGWDLDKAYLRLGDHLSCLHQHSVEEEFVFNKLRQESSEIIRRIGEYQTLLQAAPPKPLPALPPSIPAYLQPLKTASLGIAAGGTISLAGSVLCISGLWLSHKLQSRREV